jgi:RNA polymerase sigma-70 factor (ECF subfamily)
VGTWLFGILQHKAKEHWRARGREELTGDIDDAFEQRFDPQGSWLQPPLEGDRLLESRQAEELLRLCLEDLPVQQREVFHFRLIEEWGAADTASAIGCTVNHVGVLLHRARLRLRQCLDSKGMGRGR